MTETQALALDLIRQALGRYTDKPVEQIEPATQLADIDVDSLTLAELLFELEDRLNVTMTESAEVPKTVNDLIDLVEPYIQADKLKSAA